MNGADIQKFNATMLMNGEKYTYILLKNGAITLRVYECKLEELRVPDGVQVIESPIRLTDLGDGEQTISAIDCCGVKQTIEKREYNLITKRIHIPDSVEKIGNQAFAWFHVLERIYGGDNIKTIGQHAFSECGKIKALSFKSLEIIGDEAFYECESLTDMYMPNIRTIGYQAFTGCMRLKTQSII